ncbi:MAG: hypothetical protein H6733_05375 [Alphaproteobacteria bacterium]|nr:hypothetical protein [Alphaproteobacteria bacterium]
MRPFLIALPLLLTACGGIAVGCDFREGSANGPEARCQERTGLQGNPAFGGFCDLLEGDSVSGGCPDQDQIVAGCRQGQLAGEVIDWYYPPNTVADVQTTCTNEGSEFVEAN